MTKTNLFRIEAMNDNNQWDLVGFDSTSRGAVQQIKIKYDNHFMRVVECGSPRKQVWKNF